MALSLRSLLHLGQRNNVSALDEVAQRVAKDPAKATQTRALFEAEKKISENILGAHGQTPAAVREINKAFRTLQKAGVPKADAEALMHKCIPAQGSHGSHVLRTAFQKAYGTGTAEKPVTDFYLNKKGQDTAKGSLGGPPNKYPSPAPPPPDAKLHGHHKAHKHPHEHHKPNSMNESLPQIVGGELQEMLDVSKWSGAQFERAYSSLEAKGGPYRDQKTGLMMWVNPGNRSINIQNERDRFVIQNSRGRLTFSVSNGHGRAPKHLGPGVLMNTNPEIFKALKGISAG